MELLVKLRLVDPFGEVIELYAKKTAYQNNGRLAVLLVEEEGELYCDLSIVLLLNLLRN